MTVLRWLLPRLGIAVPVAIGEGVLIYLFVVPAVVWQIYQDELPHHVLEPPNVSHGAGSTDIAYYAMTYDCSAGDVVIRGEVPDSRYWMVGISDRWARAVDGGHHNHRSIPHDGSTFEVRITSAPDGRPGTLDCSSSPRGLFMYRVVLPEGDVPPPSVTIEAR